MRRRATKRRRDDRLLLDDRSPHDCPAVPRTKVAACAPCKHLAARRMFRTFPSVAARWWTGSRTGVMAAGRSRTAGCAHSVWWRPIHTSAVASHRTGWRPLHLLRSLLLCGRRERDSLLRSTSGTPDCCPPLLSLLRKLLLNLAAVVTSSDAQKKLSQIFAPATTCAPLLLCGRRERDSDQSELACQDGKGDRGNSTAPSSVLHLLLLLHVLQLLHMRPACRHTRPWHSSRPSSPPPRRPNHPGQTSSPPSCDPPCPQFFSTGSSLPTES